MLSLCLHFHFIFLLSISFFWDKYVDSIHNLFAKLDIINQASGDYNAKLGVTILGTSLNFVYILSLIFILGSISCLYISMQR